MSTESVSAKSVSAASVSTESVSAVSDNSKSIGTMRTCILSFSGSFNPIHTAHIRVLEVIKKHLEENYNMTVSTAFIAPSSDDYVRSKLGKAAIQLKDRIKLCELAIESSGNTWISVCEYGIMSSSKTASEIRRRMKIPGRTKIFEVGGADYAARSCPWRNQKPFICLGRKGATEIVKEAALKAMKAGNFILIETEIEDISSTIIRDILNTNKSTSSKGETDDVKEKIRGLLEPSVYEYIVANKLLSC